MDTHVIPSPYQAGPRTIHVLRPDTYQETARYPVLYVLPVEPEGECRFGDGLSVLRDLDVANRYGVLLVQMGFSHTPWYVDHAAEPGARAASHLELTVVPFIDQHYATISAPHGRLLIGFSKSGWGAFSMALRNPGFWGYAASWDAPLLMSTFHWDVAEAFGTVDQFDAHRPDRLALRSAVCFQREARLVLGGEKTWGPLRDGPPGVGHTRGFHELLDRLAIQHVFRDDLCVEHRWHRDWVGPMVDELMTLFGHERPRLP